MQFAYGIAFAALMLAVATLPVFFLVGELFPRIYASARCAAGHAGGGRSARRSTSTTKML
jgi:hypothetical protein